MIHLLRRNPATRDALVSLRNISKKRVNCPRNYGTRGEFDSPFDHLQTRPKKWFNWKTTTVFLSLGFLVAYNETLLDFYESYVAVDENDHQNQSLLPLQLEYKLKNLPLYQQLTHPKNTDKWYKLHSWENLDRNVLDGQKPTKRPKRGSTNATNAVEEVDGPLIKHQSEYTKPDLTTHTLATPGGILIKPVIFHNIDTDEGVTIIHVGYRLCGYPFLVHGGMIATILNETFKRNASLNQKTSSSLKDDFKVENLTIDYKNPTLANQFLIVKTKNVEGFESGKKVIALESVIEDKKGKVLVKGRALLRDTGRATNALRQEELEKKNTRKWIFF